MPCCGAIRLRMLLLTLRMAGLLMRLRLPKGWRVGPYGRSRGIQRNAGEVFHPELAAPD